MSAAVHDLSVPAPPPRRPRAGRLLRPYLLMAPALLLVAAVSFLPLGQAIWQSLHRSNYLDIGEFVGLLNYQRFLLSESGIQRAWNSVVFVAGSLAVAMPLGFGLAVLLNLPLRARGLIRTVLILPWLVSNTVAAILWAWILSAQFGPVSPVVAALGATMPNPMTSQALAMPALILCNAWGSYPLVMVFVLAALQTIPTELQEAAKIDGASGWQRFRHVVFPLVRNTTLVTLVLTTLHTFNGVSIVLIMTGGGPVGATDVMALRVFEEGFKFYRMGLATAGAVIIFALNIVFTIVYMRVLRGDGHA
ncbi:carbohydrate ABC transporter permease [Falsiroseomonas sp. HW251]|uniref:carbohydrate ABC transporter permease n=1 Tax=Falsiroseomonas sp. HW251 TaxID=3390998 RepID=UPI003D31741D